MQVLIQLFFQKVGCNMGGDLGDLVRERVCTEPVPSVPAVEQRMTQEELNQVHAAITAVHDQYKNGLITIIEYLNKVVDIRIKIGLRTNICGLLDLATGLQYPTEEELRKLDAAVDSWSWFRTKL